MERGSRAVEVDSSPCRTMATGRGGAAAWLLLLLLAVLLLLLLKRKSAWKKSPSGVSQRSRRS